jgi:hypothetical protein
MGELYDRVRDFEDKLYDWTRGIFLAERLAFAQQIELALEPLDSAMPSWNHDKTKSGVMILLSRMFNDFEAAQQLILRGLPEQTVHPVRDAIECMMVIRLIQAEPKMALRWMKDLKQYSASNCKALLDERGVECPEYAFYAGLSNLAHPNIYSSILHVSETQTEAGLIWTYHVGGMRNERWLQLAFFNLLTVVQMGLLTILPTLYVPVMEKPLDWYHRVRDLLPTLDKLGIEIEQLPDESAKPDKQVMEKLLRPYRVHTRLLPRADHATTVSSGLGLKKKPQHKSGKGTP